MKLEDIEYFAKKKVQQPVIFNLALKVIEASRNNQEDTEEIDRRLYLLTKSIGAEHLRQCSNFIAEALAYDDLLSSGYNPCWVPESRIPMPDIYYNDGKTDVPVEVKHLNNPKAEDEALYAGIMLGGSVDTNYYIGLVKMVNDFVTDAMNKFKSYNKVDTSGILYLYFSKSIEASITDGIEWMKSMENRIKTIASPMINDKIAIIIKDINESLT